MAALALLALPPALLALPTSLLRGGSSCLTEIRPARLARLVNSVYGCDHLLLFSLAPQRAPLSPLSPSLLPPDDAAPLPAHPTRLFPSILPPDDAAALEEALSAAAAPPRGVLSLAAQLLTRRDFFDAAAAATPPSATAVAEPPPPSAAALAHAAPLSGGGVAQRTPPPPPPPPPPQFLQQVWEAASAAGRGSVADAMLCHLARRGLRPVRCVLGEGARGEARTVRLREMGAHTPAAPAAVRLTSQLRAELVCEGGGAELGVPLRGAADAVLLARAVGRRGSALPILVEAAEWEARAVPSARLPETWGERACELEGEGVS
ncbi:hypothetical protein AB1Y20_014719 [Prymnesium parvum]|uniref:Uncharacterized protein n=1 Tax=Prymnesium parvum TaxID=97485 RepID=A0AB34IDP6_PRYPA